jgi:predicted esterase
MRGIGSAFLVAHHKLTSPSSPLTRSRFDVFNFDIFSRPEDEPSLLAGVAAINKLITTEIETHGIPPERIIVGGISQGGALACLTGVTTDRSLAGVFVLSSYVPLWRKTQEVGFHESLCSLELTKGQIATPFAPSVPIF